MKQEKINHSEFIKQISDQSGYAQKFIADVYSKGAEIVRDNLNDGKATQVFKGMIVYPSIYNNEYKFARARFGTFFRDLDSAILE